MITLLRDDKTIKEYLPIMGQKGYISAKSSNFGWFVNDDFAIAFVIDKRAIFKRLIFMCEVISLKDNKVDNRREKEFLQEIIEFVKSNNIADFINKAHANTIFKSCPNGANCVPWGTFVVELDKKEELLKKFKSKERQKIRRAIRDGVVVKEINDINLIYNTIKDTMQRQNSIHYPTIEYLQTLEKNLANSIKFFVAKYEDKVQGCAIVVFDKKRAYVPYAGSITKPHLGALHLMHYVAMQNMHSLEIREYDFVGTRLYDLEGSKFSGINRFKKGYNPKIERGYAFNYIIKPFKYWLFNLTIKCYLMLKGYRYEEPISQIKRDMQNPKAILWQE
jgi:hypothetical protein